MIARHRPSIRRVEDRDPVGALEAPLGRRGHLSRHDLAGGDPGQVSSGSVGGWAVIRKARRGAAIASASSRGAADALAGSRITPSSTRTGPARPARDGTRDRSGASSRRRSRPAGRPPAPAGRPGGRPPRRRPARRGTAPPARSAMHFSTNGRRILRHQLHRRIVGGDHVQEPRPAAGQQEVQRRADPVDVGAEIDVRRVDRLLGRAVVRGAHRLVGAGPVGHAAVQVAHEAEVGEQRLVVARRGARCGASRRGGRGRRRAPRARPSSTWNRPVERLHGRRSGRFLHPVPDAAVRVVRHDVPVELAVVAVIEHRHQPRVRGAASCPAPRR